MKSAAVTHKVNTRCWWHISEDLLKPHLAFSNKKKGKSECRESAFIIVSLAAAAHVLLIPNQSQSCFPTVAVAEVLWVLLYSSKSNRTIHVYHVWVFLPL